MDRRTLLQTMLIGGAAAVLSPLSLARTADWQRSYLAAREAKPWLLGWRTVEQDRLRTDSLSISGQWPKSLRGVLYRNMPARHDRGGQRYRHWFDGDGMMQAFRIEEGRVSHLGRFVETPKYVAERDAGHLLYPAFGTRLPEMSPISSPDQINVANTSVIKHGDDLLALWEGGSAWALDPDTLESRGPVAWREDLAGMPFSAHPRRDSDGSLWNFGTAGDRLLVLYHIDADGALRKAEALPVQDLPFVHDFAITERHIVFLLPPLPLSVERMAGGASVLDSYDWHPERPMRVLTVAKDDWSQQRWYEVPAGFYFHIGNAWEERNGTIHLDYLRFNDATVMTNSFRDVMRGEHSWREHARATRLTLHPAQGKAKQTTLPGKSEFPTIDPRHSGRRQRYLVVADARGDLNRPGFNALRRIDLDRETEQVYRFGDEIMVEEHVVIPKSPGAEDGDAWLLGTVLDTTARVTRLTLFDAGKLADGPVAQASLPYSLPLGFHGHFVRV